MKKKRFLGILLGLVMALGVMVGMSLVVYADDPRAYAAYDVTTETNRTKVGGALTALQVTFNGMKWYIIEDNSTAVNAGTVTLLAGDTDFDKSKFKSDCSSNSYNGSDVKDYLDKIVKGTAGDGKPNFKNVADAIQPVTLITYKYGSSTEVAEKTADAKLYLLNTTEASTVPENVRKFSTDWWLRSPGHDAYMAAYVIGGYGDVYDTGIDVDREYGVRPALQLNLSSVSFSSESNTFSLKPTATVTKAPAAKSLAYTGSAQELVTAGEATGGEMQYALGNATEATEPYSTSIPTATNAGT